MKMKDYWKKDLLDKGVKIENFDEIYPHIRSRGFFRYYQLIKELRHVKDKNKDNSPITIDQINAIYIFDIHFRRELMRIITPLEVQLKSAIQFKYDLQAEKKSHVVITSIIKTYFNSKRFKSLSIDKQAKAMKKVTAALKSVDKRSPKLEFREYIDILMIGELVTLIDLCEGNSQMIKAVLSNSTWDGDISKLIYIENLRNGAFHHNLFGRVSKNKNDEVSTIMASFIDAINIFFGEDNKAVESIKRRTIEELEDKPDLIEELEMIIMLYGKFWI